MPNFLEDILKENSFAVKKIAEDVILVEDFLSKKELEKIFNIINSATEDDWLIEYTSNLKRFCLEKFGRDDVENLVAEGKFEITQNWHDKNLNILKHEFQREIFNRLNILVEKVDDTIEVSGLATIQRMQEGVELKAHTDEHTDPSIRYATIIYLNDDYIDGELFFKNTGLSIKPKPGSLVIFPGNDEYEHGVKHVGKGPIRYVLVGFIKVKNFYSNNRY